MANEARKAHLDAAIDDVCAELARMAATTGADFNIAGRTVSKIEYRAHLLDELAKLREQRRSMDEPFIARTYGRQTR